METELAAELATDDSDDLLKKADALLRRHQRQPLAQTRTATPSAEMVPPPVVLSRDEAHLEEFSLDEPLLDEPFLDDIPTLTDVVETPPAAPVAAAPPPPPSALPDDLEARLYHELESRIAPQLTIAFQHALAGLLEEARQQIHLAVREQVERESPSRTGKPRENPDP